MRLFLVDSSIFVFRAWYGPQPERVNLQRQPNQAFIGFSDFVYRLLSEQAPSRIVFAFDESLAQSARKTIYPEYKSNRSPAPEELKRQFAGPEIAEFEDQLRNQLGPRIAEQRRK